MSIEIRNITKNYGSQLALDSVTFSVNKGGLAGFLGPNGAGKSTLMKIITGYLQPTSGEVFVNGVKVSIENIETRREVGYLPEHNPLYQDLYVKEYLEVVAGFYCLNNKRAKVAEMIDLTGLGVEQHKKIKALSKGYRQRVGLAQALIHDPSVLILDEPTTGLDPNQLEEIRNLIRKISKEKTVMLSSHIMQEVEAVCNRVLIINKGKIVADGGITELKNGNISNNQEVIAEFSENVELAQILKIEGIKNAMFENGVWKIEAETAIDIRPAVFNFAVKNNLALLTLNENKQSLESVFQQITK
jgi:ABC-2 type transport system ATP-binding protein